MHEETDAAIRQLFFDLSVPKKPRTKLHDICGRQTDVCVCRSVCLEKRACAWLVHTPYSIVLYGTRGARPTKGDRSPTRQQRHHHHCHHHHQHLIPPSWIRGRPGRTPLSGLEDKSPVMRSRSLMTNDRSPAETAVNDAHIPLLINVVSAKKSQLLGERQRLRARERERKTSWEYAPFRTNKISLAGLPHPHAPLFLHPPPWPLLWNSPPTLRGLEQGERWLNTSHCQKLSKGKRAVSIRESKLTAHDARCQHCMDTKQVVDAHGVLPPERHPA